MLLTNLVYIELICARSDEDLENILGRANPLTSPNGAGVATFVDTTAAAVGSVVARFGL